MSPLVEYALSAALIIGAVFVLVGSYGLVKLKNPMSRLHAPTKAGTLGVGGILLASVIHDFAVFDGSLNELLIMAFLFVTAPVTAHFIAKVTIHRNRNAQDLPPPGQDSRWATQATTPQEPQG